MTFVSTLIHSRANFINRIQQQKAPKTAAGRFNLLGYTYRLEQCYCSSNTGSRTEWCASIPLLRLKGRGSAVGTANAYRMDNWGAAGLRAPVVKNFNFSISSRPALGSTKPPVYNKYRGLFPRDKEAVTSRTRGSIHPSPLPPHGALPD
jgi:hypothetical protein